MRKIVTFEKTHIFTIFLFDFIFAKYLKLSWFFCEFYVKTFTIYYYSENIVLNSEKSIFFSTPHFLVIFSWSFKVRNIIFVFNLSNRIRVYFEHPPVKDTAGFKGTCRGHNVRPPGKIREFRTTIRSANQPGGLQLRTPSIFLTFRKLNRKWF